MMNHEIEQAVWQRVRGMEPPLPAAQALLPERLEALLLEEQATQAALRELSRRAPGNQRQRLQRLSARAGERSGALTTLHFLLTGRRLRIKPPLPPDRSPYPEALRTAWLRLRQTARAYTGLASEFREEARDLEAGAADAEADSRQLAALLRTGPRPPVPGTRQPASNSRA